MSFRSTTYTVTIAENTAESQAIVKPFGAFVAVLFPSTMQGTKFGFSACDTVDGTYRQVVDDTGAALSFTITVSKWVIPPAAFMAGLAALPYLKIVTETTQTSARTLKIATKE